MIDRFAVLERRREEVIEFVCDPELTLDEARVFDEVLSEVEDAMHAVDPDRFLMLMELENIEVVYGW